MNGPSRCRRLRQILAALLAAIAADLAAAYEAHNGSSSTGSRPGKTRRSSWLAARRNYR